MVKKIVKKTVAVKQKVHDTSKKPASKTPYVFAIGRRKSALAKVKLQLEGKGEITVNNRTFIDYFPTLSLQKIVIEPLELLGLIKQYDIVVATSGGGVNAQANAICLAISRALVINDPEVKTVLKKQGLMTRDSRKKERKKPGLKRARRAPQWQKR